jgi:hypothetical protein
MNERIQELYKEATGKDWAYDFDTQIAEKFTELIVKDACQQLMEWENEPFPFDERTAVWILKQHFGVK